MATEKHLFHADLDSIATKAIADEMSRQIRSDYGEFNKRINSALSAAVVANEPLLRMAVNQSLARVLKDQEMFDGLVGAALKRSADKLVGGFDATFRKIGNELGGDQEFRSMVVDLVRKRMASDV